MSTSRGAHSRDERTPLLIGPAAAPAAATDGSHAAPASLPADEPPPPPPPPPPPQSGGERHHHHHLPRRYSLEGELFVRRWSSFGGDASNHSGHSTPPAPPREGAAQDPPAPRRALLIPPRNALKSLKPASSPPGDEGRQSLSKESLAGLGITTSLGSSQRSFGTQDSPTERKGSFLYYVIYALVNSIMCIPCLFGYAAVIFRHDAFQPHISALSKLVIFSSVIHQFAFTVFSTLPFAIGQVQDAGLIFLSAMADSIADSMLEDGCTEEEIVSTTVVILGVGTASLGFLLVLMGKFRMADVVSYLPFPVVGGYLAFIGYFCVEAGAALCISQPMLGIGAWSKLFHREAAVLVLPGIVCGVGLTAVSRFAASDAALPLAMVVIPVAFYLVLLAGGWSMDDARDGGWVGKSSPPVPVGAMLRLVDFGEVHWGQVTNCVGTWAGMVFVVSFSSCLDVAAIAMDMGEALDTNNELMTVGISNFVSGLLCGQTGSYIFSQTIFTYRTGCWSRWIGILVALSFLAVVLSPVNFLEVAPLFFLGSTLMFIGFDLGYEWLIEVRHKLLLMEYIILLSTFVAIQLVGIDGGIIFGILVAVVDYVVTTARSSSVTRVVKRSRAVWRPDQWRLLQDHGYHVQSPKIVTIEVAGTVFFGSALQLLTGMMEEIGITATAEDREKADAAASPHHSRMHASPLPSPYSDSKPGLKLRRRYKERTKGDSKRTSPRAVMYPPRFVVLDLAQVANLDASAARGCFLQLAKICSKRDIVLCASGANLRVDWMLRSHDIACTCDEEERVKGLGEASVVDEGRAPQAPLPGGKLILFETLYEALEFCEQRLIGQLETAHTSPTQPASRLAPLSLAGEHPKTTVSSVFSHILGLEGREARVLDYFDRRGSGALVREIRLRSGDLVYAKGTHSDSFYIVLSGTVAVFLPDKAGGSQRILSGAGSVNPSTLMRKSSDLGNMGEVGAFLQVGSIFGFCDFVLERARTFGTVAASDGTVVARLSGDALERLRSENPALERVVDKVLLQASVRELSNTRF